MRYLLDNKLLIFFISRFMDLSELPTITVNLSFNLGNILSIKISKASEECKILFFDEQILSFLPEKIYYKNY